MTMTRRILIALALLVVLPGCASRLSLPQETHLAADAVEVAFELEQMIPLIEVTVNGHGPFLFMLDTGAAPVMVSEELAVELALDRRATRGSLQAADGARHSVSELARVETVSLGGATFRNLDAVIIPQRNIQGGFERELRGIVGFELFRDCLVTLDYPDRRVRFERGALPPVDHRRVLPMAIDKGVPRVSFRLGEVECEMVVDSGNNKCFVVPEDYEGYLRFAHGPVDGPPMYTIAGTSSSQLGRLNDSATFGDFRVSHPLVALLPDGDPMVGAKVLRHFRITFDSANASVAFDRRHARPIRVESPTYWALSIDHRHDGWFVSDVIPNSPAVRAGVEVGDEITGFGGYDAGDLSTRDKDTILRKLYRHGHDLEMRLVRDGGEFEVSIPPVIRLLP